jgi:hypothetical protein
MLALKLILLTSLVGALVVALYSMGRKAQSLSRQRKTRERVADASAKAREGDIPTAMRLLLKAEKSWSLNCYDGRPQSLLRDLDEYGQIAGSVFRILNVRSGPVYHDLNGILDEMRRHLSDRSNFAVDGRRLKPDAAARWNAMRRRLNDVRPKVRATCDLKSPR